MIIRLHSTLLLEKPLPVYRSPELLECGPSLHVQFHIALTPFDERLYSNPSLGERKKSRRGKPSRRKLKNTEMHLLPRSSRLFPSAYVQLPTMCLKPCDRVFLLRSLQLQSFPYMIFYNESGPEMSPQ